MLNLRKTLKIDIIFGRAITALESGAMTEAAARPARLHGNRRQSDNQCARDRRPFRSRVTAVFTRHDFAATSCRAAISFVVRECRSAGD
jgi:hypothetical protein